MQWYPRLGTVRLAIGDCGIGIRKSLSSSSRYAYLSNNPHYEAAWKAFGPGVSRSREGGFGLTTVMDNVGELGGTLVLATGDGYVRTSRARVSRYGSMRFELPGVQIEVRIPTR